MRIPRRMRIVTVVVAVMGAGAQLGTASVVLADTQSGAGRLGLFYRGGSSGRTMPWIKLTGPGGEPVHINVTQITSIKSDAESPGARTQLDLASGKFQRVQEDLNQVMRLVSAALDARENNETADASLCP
jgi:hypothetical protein